MNGPPAGAAVASHEVAVFRVGADQHAHVCRGKSGGQEPSRHGPGGARRVPQGVRGVDFDELAEDDARQLAVGGGHPGLGRAGAGQRARGEGNADGAGEESDSGSHGSQI